MGIFLGYKMELVGFSCLEARRIAYQLATKFNLKHKFNSDEELAEENWMKDFLKRHPNLSLRKPDDVEVRNVQVEKI